MVGKGCKYTWRRKERERDRASGDELEHAMDLILFQRATNENVIMPLLFKCEHGGILSYLNKVFVYDNSFRCYKEQAFKLL